MGAQVQVEIQVVTDSLAILDKKVIVVSQVSLVCPGLVV